jgi:hypothetical protein
VPQAFHDNVEACAHISFTAFGQEATTAHLSFVLMGEEEEGEGGKDAVPEFQTVVEDAAGEERIEKQASDDSSSSSSSGGDDGKRRALKAVSSGRADTKEGEVVDIESIKDDNDGEGSDSQSSGTTLTMVLLVGSVFYFPTQAEMYEFMQVRMRGREGEGGKCSKSALCRLKTLKNASF